MLIQCCWELVCVQENIAHFAHLLSLLTQCCSVAIVFVYLWLCLCFLPVGLLYSILELWIYTKQVENSGGLYKGRKHCRLRSSGRPINPPCQLENTFLLTNEPHSHLYSRLSRPCSPSSFLQVETKWSDFGRATCRRCVSVWHQRRPASVWRFDISTLGLISISLPRWGTSGSKHLPFPRT